MQPFHHHSHDSGVAHGSRGTAIVTGASSGIGEVYARRLAGLGYGVVLVARRAGRLERTAGELRNLGAVGVEILTADLGDEGDVAAVAARAARDDVALLVNNAGLSGYARFAEADPWVLASVVKVNALAPVLLSRAAVPGMVRRGHGAIVNVASMLAFSGGLPPGPLPHRATYAATKAHVVAFTRTLAHELEGTGVRVQVCCPGYTESEFHLSVDADPVSDAALAGRDGADPRAMPAEDVVTASLVALERGELVCMPGVEDPGAFPEFVAAEAALRAQARSTLAPRYRGALRA
jgi:short-subunit dehydrogenase